MQKVNTSKTKDHFDKVDEQSVKCKLCNKVLKTGGGTSNMLSHLTRKHPQANKEPPPSPSRHDPQNTNTNKSTKTFQQTKIQGVLSVSSKKNIDEKLRLMCASDF